MIAHSGLASHLAFIALAVTAVAVHAMAWSAGRRRSIGRPVAWAVGWLVLLASTSPTVETWAARSFTGHMLQHLLMVVVAAPLLAVAAPLATVGHALRSRLGTVTRWRRGERTAARRLRAVGPVVAPLTFVGVLFVTHLTPIYDRALDVRWVHDAEHLAYVVSASLLWAVVRTSRQGDAVLRIGMVFAVIGGSALLGVVLLSADSPLVATYADRLGDAEALSDQRAAASLMWVGGMASSLPLLIAVVWRWAEAEDRMARHGERLTERRVVGGRDATPGTAPTSTSAPRR